MSKGSARRAFLTTMLAGMSLLVATGARPATAAAGSPVGTLAGGVHFSQECGGSDIGVGITYDGANLWYSCYNSSPDLLRADPRTGQVTAAYNIDAGLGALAYDATRNAIWAGWAGPNPGDIRLITLDSSHSVSGSSVAFNTCKSSTCSDDIDDGLSYDGGNDALYFSPDTSQTIYHYSTQGALLTDGPSGNGAIPWAGGGNCYNSGLAIGDQYLFQGAAGCSHVYVVDKANTQNVLYDFSTAIPGDPNFRDEGLACDPNTFNAAGQQVMWSKEAYAPMRANAFVIPNDSCGVGGLAVGGSPTTPTGFHGPLPLIAAHGITAQPADVAGLLAYGQNTVAGLNDASNGGRTALAQTGPISSVWDNGEQIARDADAMISRTGAPAVNVIAHSKGGLDTREAIYTDPGAIANLGMLATPNGGSKLANKLCFLRRLNINFVFGSQGACDNDSNGLYDLQTGYVTEVFNQVVRDDPSVGYYVAAGNCSTKVTTFLCNATANLGLDCELRGGDSVVCVDSAFYLAQNYDHSSGSGLHTALDPIFQDYDHSAMSVKACPVTRVLAELYPYESQGNTWLDSGGTGCENSGSAPNAAPNAAPNDQAPVARAATQPTAGIAASTPVAATVDQAVLVGAVKAAGGAYTATIDPEGGNTAGAYVFTAPGVIPTVTVTDSSGRIDTAATFTTASGEASLGAQVTRVALTGLRGASRRLSVTAAADTGVAVQTLVEPGGPALAAALTPVGAAANGTAPFVLTATLAGLPPGQARTETVTASYQDAAGVRRSSPVAYDQGSRSFTANLTLPAGAYTPVDVIATGPVSRYFTTDEFVDDGTGSLGAAHGDSLVNTTGTGAPNVLRVPVPVTVASAGTYHLSLDLTAVGGAVASAEGTAMLSAGTATVNVDVPLTRLFAGGQGGVFHVRNALLTRGTSGRTRVASAADLGSTGPYALSALGGSRPELSRLHGEGLDTNHDGVLDTLAFDGSAYTPTPGNYVLTGQLYDPAGNVLKHVQQSFALATGANPLHLSFDGGLVGANGSGTYRLAGITLTSLSDQSQQAHVSDALAGPFDASGWDGSAVNPQTLQQLWDRADAAGHIHRGGLYVSNRNRLSRVAAGTSRGDIATTKNELDTFIGQVASEPAIDQPDRDAITVYARRLRASYGP